MFQKNKNQVNAQKILVIDEGVLDSEILLADLQPDFKVVRLSSNLDPITQISQALSEHSLVSEVAIVAHGQPGQINFSNYPIDQTLLVTRESELANWVLWLTVDAKICIYSCSLASGEIGQKFIHTLKDLTGAEIASSSLPIGKVGVSQNWSLDRFTQSFEVFMPFSAYSTANYAHTLAPEITISGASVVENGTMTFEVKLSELATDRVDIFYRTREEVGTALGEDIDYREVASSVRINAGQDTAFFSVGTFSDARDEADESVVVELFNPTNSVFANGAETLRATGVILDSVGSTDNRALFVSDAQLIEGDDGSQQAVFEVQLSRSSTSAITLDYTTSDGSALAGQDYQSQTGSVTFDPGETLQSVAVPLIGDTVAEANEFFNLVFTPTADIANGVDGAVGTATILDDDTSSALPEISISGAETVENGFMTFQVKLSEPATNRVDIFYRTREEVGTALGEDIDYREVASSVRINAGQDTAFFSVGTFSDARDEADESVVVELFNPTNSVFANGAETLRATGVILDSVGSTDNRALFVSDAQLIEGDDGSQQAVFEVQLSRSSTSAITLDYTTSDGSALAGQDYQSQTGSVTFDPGETLQSVAVPLIGDTVAEANEFFNLVFTPTADIANGVDGAVGTATILDDDTSSALPEISISGAETVENGFMTFQVKLSEPATDRVDIFYRTREEVGTALGEDIDYREVASSVRINAGQDTAFFSVGTFSDARDEADESVVVELFNPTNSVFANGAETLRATGVILDSVGSTDNRALFVSDAQLIEGDDGSQQAVFEVQLSRSSTSAITLDYTTSDGSALAGQDYQSQTGSVTFDPGETLQSVAVPLIGDTVAEANEFFNLVFTPTADIANGVDGAVGTATILDDDTSSALPEISISGAETVENGFMTFQVKLSEPATDRVDIFYRTREEVGTALGEDIDYREVASSVRINAGQDTAFFSVGTFSDARDEADESVVVELFNPTNSVFANGAETLRATGVILDSVGSTDNRALFVSDAQLIEGDDGSQQAVFEVQLSRSSTSAITLDYTTSDGSALAGQDYQSQTGSVTFDPGETLQSVAVPLIGDTVAEANEFFNLVFTPTADIANGVDGAVGTATILDDDTSSALPEISISGAETVENGFMTFQVKLSEPATNRVDIFYRTREEVGTALGEDIDYREVASSVRINAGQDTAFFSVGTFSDARDEADESVVVELFNPTNSVFANGAETLRATGVILDSVGSTDNRALFVSDAQLIEGDDGSQQAVFEVQLSRSSTSAITLDYTTSDGSALAGQDYQSQTGSVTFDPGETLQSVAVPLIGDTVAEANEFFNLVFTPTADIANGVDGAVGTATILDDDTSSALPEISISGAETIENGFMTFQVKLSEPATNRVDIFYRTREEVGTALGEDIDYREVASSVRINAGQDTAFFSVRTFGDAFDEADESVVVELFNPINAVFADGVDTLQATGIILDNDGTGNNLGLFVGNAQIVEGENNYTREVAVPIHLSRPSDQTLTFQYQTADGSAQAGDDYTSQQSGTVTFLPGQTLAAAFVPIIGDDVTENDETFTLTVTPTSEIANGTDGATGTITIIDGNIPKPPSVGVSLNLGGDATINEGNLVSRTITFSDDVDANADGWTYSVDYGDGSAIETGNVAAGVNSFDISHAYADGNANHNVSVTVTDIAGDSDTEQFTVTVNNVAPIIALAGAAETNTGASYTLNLGAITDPGDDTVTSYIVDWGDGSSDTFNTAGDVTHTYTTTGSNTISVDLVDEDGTHTSAETLTVNVLPPTPGVSINPLTDETIDEGNVASRTITFSDGEDTNADGWTYSVDYGDGSAIETGNVAAGVNSFDISHAYADGNANHNVSVTVTDIAGDSDTEQFTVTVNNVAPIIALAGAAETNTGASYTLNLGAITDPGDDTVTSYIVDWGDGSSDTFNTAGDVTHTYTTTGSNTISVDLVDEDGTHTSAETLTVNVLPPTPGVSINPLTDETIDEGNVASRTITFSDGEDTNADGWAYSVDYGDGSAIETGNVAAGVNSFDISHAYADGNTNHNVSVTVTDIAGDSDTEQFTVTVNNVAPIIALAGAAETNTGASYTLNLGAITDPGDDTVTSYIVDWGDGSSDTFNTAGDVTHTYTTTGSNTISVDLVDEDGTHTSAETLTVNVLPPTPGVSINPLTDETIDEGNVASRTITFSDGEDTNADGWAYSVDYGDGSAIETGNVAAGVNSFDISHAYADGNANHDVSVTVTDIAGDSDTEQFTVTVNNVAPIIALAGAAETNTGASYTLNLGAITDPGDDTVTSYIVDWGDGSSDTFNTAGDVTHTYTTTGSNTISVDLVDEDGTHTNAGNLDVTVMSSGQPVNIIGTPGNDNLIGTNLDENLLGNGGAFDFFTGGGGADIFTFTTGSGNGREVGTITDYMPGEDMIDLDGSTILTSFGTGSTTYLFLDGGEFDTLIVNGVGTVADIDFL